MQYRSKILFNLTVATALAMSLGWLVLAQSRSRERLAGRIEEKSTVRVRGSIHPKARTEYDRGRADASLPMQHMTIVFKQTAAQQADLNTLLREQTDPSSPEYHQWLTPEGYADRFGLSEADVDKIVSWLEARGFRIDESARSRTWVAFTGSVQQVESAFATEIHRYEVAGEMHIANAQDPAVPAALSNVVAGFRSLNDFHLKPRYVRQRVSSSQADYNYSTGGPHFMVPDDFATIYDLQSLYARGINGSGQKIAIMGQTNISLTDTRAFLTNSGLAANDPTTVLVPGSGNPGISSYDLPEADLDMEWSMAVARRANIIYVNSTDAIDTSLPYAIDQKLAPVVSISYGDCEAAFSATEVSTMMSLAQQANAQGQTILGPAGDNGATDCDGDLSEESLATLGLSVDMPASLPNVTGVGGSEFNEVGTTWNSGNQLFGTLLGQPQPAYWSANNNSLNGSALRYIPEMAWNDAPATGALLAGGGGQSILFPKPVWQAGIGVPNDGVRDVPDISLGASPQFDGFLICTDIFNSNGQGVGDSCTNGFRYSDGSLYPVGGTSVSTPAFAGIVALLNQATGSSQGNINPELYALAANPSNVASVNSTRTTVFHDITLGGNAMPCQAGTPSCPLGGYIGFSAGPGYDLTTGLGSVDVANLIAAWGSATPTSAGLPLPAPGGGALIRLDAHPSALERLGTVLMLNRRQ